MMNVNDNIEDGQYVLWQYLLSVHVSQQVGESNSSITEC